jgi:hypothetical protein
MSLRNTSHRVGVSDRTTHSVSFVSTALALLVAIASGASFAGPAPVPTVPDLLYIGLPSTPLRTYVTDGTGNAIVRSGRKT